MDLDDCRFFEWSVYSSPIKLRGKQYRLFKGTQEESYSLFFFIKDGNAYEFFTKTDISELLGVKRPISGQSFDYLESDGPIELDQASFAKKVRVISENHKKKEKYRTLLIEGLSERRAKLSAYRERCETQKRENEQNIDWLKDNL